MGKAIVNILQEEEIRREWYDMRAEERLRAEGRLVDGETASGDILAQVRNNASF